RTPPVEVLPPRTDAAKEAARVEEAVRQSFTPPPLYNPPPPQQKSGGIFGGVVAGLIAGAVAAALVVYAEPYWHPQPPHPAPGVDQSADLAALQAKVDA